MYSKRVKTFFKLYLSYIFLIENRIFSQKFRLFLEIFKNFMSVPRILEIPRI